MVAWPASGSEIAVIFCGAILGGFVNGLAGFGTGLMALPLWLQVLAPVPAAQLVSATSVAGHLLTLPAVWPAIAWRKLAPMLIAGLSGVPIGVYLLPRIEPTLFKLALGLGVITFSLGMLAATGRLNVPRGGRLSETTVGFLSGILGGLAGLSGILPTAWTALGRWPKDERRVAMQAFNMTVLGAMLAASLAQRLISVHVLLLLAIAFPGTFLGSRLGTALYRRLDDHRFDRAALLLLLLSGLSLVWFNRP